MIRLDRVWICLTRVKMVELLRINKYKADFTEFTAAWVISNRVNRAKSARIKHYVDSADFGNFTTEYAEL